MTDAAGTAARGTHDIRIRSGCVTKRFRSWDRDEPQREWRALRLLAAHAPGIAPTPIRADLDGHPPSVVMSRLPGTPLCPPLTPTQTQALAAAICTLHRCLPQQTLRQLPDRIRPPAEAVTALRRRCLQRPALGPEPLVVEAFTAAAQWLRAPQLDTCLLADAVPVFGHADGNLANALWDGTRVRLVDFEDSGRSTRAFELGDLCEHPSSWVLSTLDVAALLAQLDLTRDEATQLREWRRLYALFWLLMLLPGKPAEGRNPPGTPRRQAERLLSLLASAS